MDKVKNDVYYVMTILKDINFIIANSKNLSKDDLFDYDVLTDSFIFRLIQISEMTSRISNEFKEANQEIPWIDIKGFRNRLVHDYGSVDLHFVFDVVTKDIYTLKSLLEKAIE